MITQNILKKMLRYDAETGMFTWIVEPRNATPPNIGDIAGCVCKTCGYVLLRIKGKLYRAHRLAFVYMTGSFPKAQVDHINGIRADNRWSNLREASNQENSQNHNRAHKDNKTGVLGVNKKNNRYQAQISVNGKNCHIGYFATVQEASTAYIQSKRKYHKSNTL